MGPRNFFLLNRRPRERFRRVAPRAVRAEAAIVDVVAGVARGAFAAGFGRLLARRVAGGADQAAMFSG